MTITEPVIWWMIPWGQNNNWHFLNFLLCVMSIWRSLYCLFITRVFTPICFFISVMNNFYTKVGIKRGKLLPKKLRRLWMKSTNKTQKSTRKLNWYVSLLTEIFLNQKRIIQNMTFICTVEYCKQYSVPVTADDAQHRAKRLSITTNQASCDK